MKLLLKHKSKLAFSKLESNFDLGDKKLFYLFHIPSVNIEVLVALFNKLRIDYFGRTVPLIPDELYHSFSKKNAMQ